MKIGYFTDSYLPSPDGVATAVESSAKELINLGHEVTIIAPNQPHLKDRKQVIRLVSVHIMKSPDVWWGLEVPQPAFFKIADLEFDIIHGHSGGPISVMGWQLAYLNKIPFVQTYHTSWEHYQHYFPLPQLFTVSMIKKLNRFFNNECDAVITPSVKAKNELLREGISKPVYVIPNGIFPDKFTNQKKGFLHEKLTIPKDKKIILTVGRLHKEKSIDFLIKAFASSHKTHPDTVFVIIGKGQKLEELQKLTVTLGISDDVYFTGTIAYNDMPKVYADADLFLFASSTETQGLVIIEALASGVPVISVQDEAFMDVVENGVNGYLMRKDKRAFASKIRLLLRNESLRAQLGSNARKSIEKFSAEFTVKILEQVYEDIIYNKTAAQFTQHTRNIPAEFKEILSFSNIEEHISKEYTTLKALLRRI